MNKYIKSLFFVGLLSASLVPALSTQAAQPLSPQGITITPAFQQVSIPVGADQQPINFSITNNETSSQTLSLSAADFNTLNESGGLFFVGTNPTDLQKKYGLAKWLSLPQTKITLAPKQTAAIHAAVLNLPELAPGGHYGALMIADQNSGINDSNTVALHPIASSLLFVTKLGGDTHKLSLQSVSLKHGLFSLPTAMTLNFHNDGNTHLVPRGSVSLINSSGKLIAKGIINQDSNIILPQLSRLYSVPLRTVSKSSLPGRYKVNVDFRFDGINQFRSYQQSIIYLPLRYFDSLVVLIVMGLGIVAFRLRKRRLPKNTNKHKIVVHNEAGD